MNDTAKQYTDDGSQLTLFDGGEISILRAYFGLRLRKTDPPLESLYAEPDEDHWVAPHRRIPKHLRQPVRLLRCGNDGGPVTDLNHAVARICLSDVQQDLPQWVDESLGRPIYGRYRFETPKRTHPPQPKWLLEINWATSGFGVPWRELYCVTHIPTFKRNVVTVSLDSTDSWGVTDFALGWFPDRQDEIAGSRRTIIRWWRRIIDNSDQTAWEEARGYAIDEDEAWSMRRRVWPHADDDDEVDWLAQLAETHGSRSG